MRAEAVSPSSLTPPSFREVLRSEVGEAKVVEKGNWRPGKR
jgi:hypothetical protein